MNITTATFANLCLIPILLVRCIGQNRPSSSKLPIVFANLFCVEKVKFLSICALLYLNVFTINTAFSATTPIFSPVDTIIGGQLIGTSFDTGASGYVVGDNNWPSNEGPEHLLDGVGQKYLNFGEFNTGVIVTPDTGCSIVDNMKLWPANDARPRDPSSYKLYGTNEDISGTSHDISLFTLISEGNLALPSSRNSGGNSSLSTSNLQAVSFVNTAKYASYLLLFPGVKNSNGANSMQIAEVQLYGSTESCEAPIIPKIEYRFDEFIWNGTPSEVFDSSGNNYNGAAVGGVSTVEGKICNAANIPNNSSATTIEAVNTGVDLDTVIGSVGTISFWYKANSAWNSGSDKRLFDATDGNKYFFADISNGKINFWFEDGNDGDYQKTTVATFTVDAGEWKYLSFAWDVTNSIVKIFVDGVEQALSGGDGGTNPFTGYDTLYFGDNRDGSYLTGESSADGLIDEVLIFDSVISESQVEDIFDYQKTDNNNYDGTPRVCPVPPVPLLEYRFDELSWNGTAAELNDNSSSLLHGQSSGGVSSQDAKICRGATFDGIDDHFSLPPITSTSSFSSGFSAMGWVDFGSIQYWERIFDFSNGSTNNNIVFARNGTSNSLTFEIYNGNSSCGQITASNAIQSGLHHYAVTLLPNKNVVLYRDGVAIQSGTSSCLPTNVTRSTNYIGRSAWSSDGYFENQIDELKVFDSGLTPSKILDIFNNENAGNNYDGTVRSCPVDITPLAEYRFEEPSWDGSADEVIDSSGNDYHGQVVRSSTLVNPSTSSPAALTGDPGTCNFISQNSGSIKITGLDKPEGIGLDLEEEGKTTVTFWMKWDGSNSVMPIGWNYHDIWMYNNSMGFNTWNSDMYGISSEDLAGSWHHVAVEFTNGSVFSNRMYIDGIEQVLTSQRYHSSYSPRSPNDDNAYVKAEMRIGGVSNSSSYDFRGLLDEVRVYKGVLTTDQVVTIMNERHDCNTPTIHHYEIVHDGQGLTCEAESYTVKACTDASCSSLSTESVTLDVQADGNTINSPTFTGTTTVSFNHTVAETLTLSLANTSIGASEPVKCNGGSDCNIIFADTGFKFSSSILSNAIPEQLSAKPSNIGFNASTLNIQAIKTNTNTGACQAALIDTTAIEMAATCVDPVACAGSQVAINNLSSTTNIATVGSAASLTYDPVTLNFGGDTSDSADFIFTYPDAGKVTLHARYSILDENNDPTGKYMLGSSLPFVVRPFGFFIDVAGNPKAQSAGQANSAFVKAGENFTTSLSAVQWQAVDDDLLGEANDGIPDTDADLSDNSVTANFGNELVAENAIMNDSLYLPNPGVEGSLTNDSFTDFTNGVATNGVANNKSMTYSEVGIVNFTANLTGGTYLGAGDITGVAPYVGRFIPDHFDLSTGFDGNIISVCDLTSPSSETVFAYTGQVTSADASKGVLQYKSSLQPELLITARSSICQSGFCTVTQNYTGDFMKLSPDGVDYIIPVTDAEPNKVGALGTPITLLANMNDGTLSDEADGVITYAFNVNDNFVYIREQNSEISPFLSLIELGINAVKDADDVLAIDSDGVVGNNRLWVLSPESKEIRFGRVSLANSFGPETSPIGQSLTVEYFDGSKFVVGDTDTCSRYTSANISFGANNDVGLNLTDIPSVVGSFDDISDLPNGITRQIVLPAVAAGNQGVVDVIYDTYSWLKYDWNWNGVEVKTFDENPSAIATYGMFRGNDRIIYNREVF